VLFNSGEKEVRMQELEGLLNSAFDEKLSSINSKASGLILSIEQAKSMLAGACDRFDKSNAPPDRESIRAASESYVVEQKSVYTSSLRRLIGAERPLDESNLYTSYHSKLVAARTLMDEILKVNNKFRIVLEAYANELGRFRSAYSAMERAVKELGIRLETKGAELKEYDTLLQEIERFAAFTRELEELERAVKEVDAEASTAKAGSTDSAGPLRESLSAKLVEISNIDRAISDARSTIASRLAPLEKPARKYEHGATSKMHLTYYLEDPVNALSGKEDGVREFTKHVISLKKEVQENRIAVKNTGEVLQAADFVINEDLPRFIEEIGILRSKRKAALQEASELERAIRDVERIEGEKMRKVTAASELKDELARIEKAKEAARANIEGMFGRFYRKNIRIAAGQAP
jgi:chromosome segregation ATPase